MGNSPRIACKSFKGFKIAVPTLFLAKQLKMESGMIFKYWNWGMGSFLMLAHCLKITQNVAFEFWHFLAFSNNFCPIKSDLSGNTA